MISVAFWLITSIITCALWPIWGTLTLPLALVIFVAWAVLTWGGIFIIDDDWF